MALATLHAGLAHAHLADVLARMRHSRINLNNEAVLPELAVLMVAPKCAPGLAVCYYGLPARAMDLRV